MIISNLIKKNNECVNLGKICDPDLLLHEINNSYLKYYKKKINGKITPELKKQKNGKQFH